MSQWRPNKKKKATYCSCWATTSTLVTPSTIAFCFRTKRPLSAFTCRTGSDNELAAKKAIDLLNHSVYATNLSQPGLFFNELDARSNS